MALNFGQIIQYATLVSLLMGGLGLVVAVLIHREQVKTQIFLALSAQYDDDAVLHPGFIDPSFVSRAPHTETNVGVDAALR